MPLTIPLLHHAGNNQKHNVWLCLRWPNLALYCQDHNAEYIDKSIIVYQHHTVIYANAHACEKGIQPGMSVNTAYSLQANLICRMYDEKKEMNYLQTFAQRLYKITPHIKITGQLNIMLEISQVLHLYDDLQQLLSKIHILFNSNKIDYQYALAHTEKSASLFINNNLYPLNKQLTDQQLTSSIKEDTLKRIKTIKISCLDCEPEIIKALLAIGMKHVSDVLVIPTNTLGKRYGKALIHYLDQLLGNYQKPIPLLEPKKQFFNELEFDFEIESSEFLTEPIEYLLTTFSHYLNKQQWSVNRWILGIYHPNSTPSEITINSTIPLVYTKQLLELTLIKLDRQTLDAYISGVYIKAEQFTPLNIDTEDLFSEFNQDKSIHPLIDKLTARLGEDACYQLIVNNDQRAEYAFKRNTDNTPISIDQSIVMFKSSRPSWLVKQPIALHYKTGKIYYKKPLELVSGPEKFALAWWENEAYQRDYYIAKDKSNAYYWLYFDCIKDSWFLHGFF